MLFKKKQKKRQLSLHSAWRVEASLPSKQSQYRRINSQGFRQLSAKEKENLHQFTAELLYFICFSVGDVLWVCLRGTSSVTHPDSYQPRTLPQPLPRPSPLEVAPSILQNAVRFCIPASATAPSHLSTPSHAHTSLPLPLCLLCLSLPLATCALESPTNAGGARAPIRRLAPALRDTWPCRSVASAASAAAGQHCRTRPHSAMTHSRMSIFSFNFLVSGFECSSTIHAFPTSSLTLSLSFSPCLQCILGRIVEQAPG